MIRFVGVLPAIGLICATPAVAQTNPFGIGPVGNASLASVRGAYGSPGFARNARVVIDQQARLSFDATAGIARVTFDNWFAREGADLIAAGALGRPLILN